MSRFNLLTGLRLVLLFLVLGSTNILAAIDEYEFSSEDDRALFRKLTAEMRCPKCLNSNLSGSDAPIAADLRAEIYDQITAGRSEEEIVDFMRERYGDFIMYRPPVNTGTAVLWFGPAVLLVAGFIFLRVAMRGSHKNAQGELSGEEQAELDRILAEQDRQQKELEKGQ